MADVNLEVDFGVVYLVDKGSFVKIVADKYSAEQTYAVGDYVLHNDLLYKCITAIGEPEEFDAEKWVACKLANEVKSKADASSLSKVATSGNYNDLENKPSIPAAQVNSNWNANSGVSQILNKPNLATVATSGNYNDLNNKPSVAVIDDTQASVNKVYSSNKVDSLVGGVNDKLNLIADVDTDTYIDVPQSEITKTSGYFKRTSGNDEASASWDYYAFNVNEGEKYKITAFAGQAARLWIELNSNNQVVDYSSDSTATSEKTEIITIGSGISKVVVNCRNNSGETYSIQKSEGATAKIKESALKDILSNSKLYGKILCCVGDSITYGEDIDAEGISQTSKIEVHQWSGVNSSWNEVTSNFRHTYGYQIAERNNMVFWNGGVSGSTMQGIEARRGFSLANGRYTKLPDNIDYLLIWFGWNDTAFGTLGTINDNTNESYYGGYNVVLPYLINKYPYTKIALVVPFGTDENHRNAVRELGNKWGVAVWDNYMGGTPLYYGKEDSVGVNASIVTSNRAKFQANGAHPNFKGHRQLADMIEQFLKGI